MVLYIQLIWWSRSFVIDSDLLDLNWIESKELSKVLRLKKKEKLNYLMPIKKF